MTKPVRFGILGAGVIAPHHARAIAQDLGPQGSVSLVAVTDVVAERAEKLANQFGGARIYTDYKKMLADKEIDAVAICTPSGMHAQQTIDALNAGKHVVVEKPVDVKIPVIDELISVWKKSGKIVAVISQHRFAHAYQTTRKLLQEEKLGKITQGDAAMKWWRSQEYYDSGDWRGTFEFDGGGCMMNQGVHTIDMLQWVMGPAVGRVVSVTAYVGTLAKERIEVEDSAVAILKFESGALGALNFTTSAYPGLSTKVEVHGNKGTAVVENEQLKYLYFDRDNAEKAGAYGGGKKINFADEYQPAVAVSQGVHGSADPAAIANRHALHYMDFVEALETGRPPVNTPEDARRPVEIILACYKSSQLGKEIRLPL